MPPIAVVLTVLVAEFVVHYHIDWGKEQIVKRFDWRSGPRFWNAIGFDQLLHGLTYLAIVVYVAGWIGRNSFHSSEDSPLTRPPLRSATSPRWGEESPRPRQPFSPTGEGGPRAGGA